MEVKQSSSSSSSRGEHAGMRRRIPQFHSECNSASRRETSPPQCLSMERERERAPPRRRAIKRNKQIEKKTDNENGNKEIRFVPTGSGVLNVPFWTPFFLFSPTS